MALRSLSTSALRAELTRREKGAKKFIARHTKLSKAIAAIERTLTDLGVGAMGMAGGTGKRRGRPPGSKNKKRGRNAKAAGRGRGKNAMSLPLALASAVRVGSTVSPAQAAVAVKRAGYRSSSKTFGQAVAITLAKSPAFKRTGRGAYLRKGVAPAPAKRGRKPTMNRRARKPGRRGRKAARRAVGTQRKPAAAKPTPAVTAAAS